MICRLAKRRSVLILLALLLFLPGPIVGGVGAAALDWDVPGGRFYSQAGGGDGRGYSVTDDSGVRFWSEFRRLGGVSGLGYPISGRLEWDGFTVQAFQRGILQWRPEVGRAYLVNVFDRLHDLGRDDYLWSFRQTPPPRDWPEAGLSWSEVIRGRLSVLDRWPALRAKYYSAPIDPLTMYGLPTSDVVDVGNHYALRLQRAVLQQWKEPVPWAAAGEVTVALGGDIVKELGILASEPGQPSRDDRGPAGTPSGSRRLVLGYYVPYDASSWQTLEAQATNLDLVSAQWVTVDPCGSIGSRDDVTIKAFLRERGVRLVPSLLTSSGWLNHRLLTDEPTTDRFLNEIVSYVLDEGYDGFDLDLEGVSAQDRGAYTTFVARLAEALHRHGKLLTLAIPAKTSDVQTGWAGAYDYAALGKHADLILIMSYAYTWSTSQPGSTAPYDWVDRVAAYAAGQIPREKLLLGIAFYGYDWNVTMGGAARALLHPQAMALARHYGATVSLDPSSRSATFSYTARAEDEPYLGPSAPPVRHQISTRTASPCGVRPPYVPPPTPTPKPPPAPIQRHVVWLEDGASVGARLDIASRHGAGGVGAWRLGQEDPSVWERIAAWRRAR